MAQLDPSDSLFTRFGLDFLNEEKKLFGTHGAYAADPFHESAPPINTPEYMNAVGRTIHNLFQTHHSGSLWVMQAWSLREDIVKAVPQNSLLILDLSGDNMKKHHNYWGYPFIVGNLHNFGGRINLHGDLNLIASNQYLQVKATAPNVCGSGLFMEAIEQNPLYYELVFEIPIHQGSVDLDVWLRRYAERRYGVHSDAAIKAMNLLLDGPYREGTNGTEQSSIIAARPALNVKKSGPNAGFKIPYLPQILIDAQELLLKDADKLSGSKPYRFDVVDLQRQIMTNLGQEMHKKTVEAFINGDKKNFKLHSGRFIELMRDVDTLLGTRREYSFDAWLADAIRWGDTRQEKEYFEKDATELVTVWGVDGNDPLIFDYSWREWSGLVGGYYLKRWEMFYDMLSNCLDNGRAYSEQGLKLTHGRESFRANDFYSKLADWELSFVNTYSKVRPIINFTNEIAVTKRIFEKYRYIATEYYVEQQDVKVEEENRYENLGL